MDNISKQNLGKDTPQEDVNPELNSSDLGISIKPSLQESSAKKEKVGNDSAQNSKSVEGESSNLKQKNEAVQKKEIDEVLQKDADDELEGNPILMQIKSMTVMENDGVIYGVYDNRSRGITDRINDFFIDHKKVSVKDKANFFHMLAVMVDAGIPVVQAVKSIAGRVQNRKLMRVLNTVVYNAEQGLTLSDAMQRFSGVFDSSEIGIVRSGEATGRLDVMLFKLSERLDKRNELSSKLVGAAIYPVMVILVLILVAVGMLLWVFPTLLNLLEEGGEGGLESLPFATRALIVVQDAVVNYWWLMLLVVFVVYGVFLFYVGTSFGKIKWDFFKLRVPKLGDMLRKLYTLRFVDMLGLLIESGVPVLESLTITGNSITNQVYKLKTQEIIKAVKKGGKISVSMGDSAFLFAPEVVQMINIAENTATLGPITAKIAKQYEVELDNSLKRFTSIFEPLMMLFVGVFVAFLALAIMSPIFNLSSIVG